MQPLFSLLIAHYNNDTFFKECYKSIIGQTYSNWEVVLVDDHSNPDSLQNVRKIIKGDKRFRVYCNKTNRGCGYTKNRCATLAKGDIAGFLDPDDFLAVNALELMVETHLKYPKISIVTSTFIKVDSGSRKISVGEHGESLPVQKSYLTFGKGALTHFATFKIKYYIRSLGIDKNLPKAVDQDLYYKMEEEGKHFFLDEKLYYYRTHEGNISQGVNLSQAQCWHLYVILKASERRHNKSLDIDNLTNHTYKNIKVEYFWRRSKLAGENKNYIGQAKFLIKYLVTKILPSQLAFRCV